MKYDKNKFSDWLRNNTTLLEGTIYTYSSVIHLFYVEYTKLTMENIASFISKKNRETNAIHVRAPFVHYLKYMGMKNGKTKEQIKDMTDSLPSVRRLPNKKQAHHLDRDTIRKVIRSIENKTSRDIAILQYYTGARAFEIVSLRREKIISDTINEKKVIRLTLIVKQNKERDITIPYKIAKGVLKKYIEGSNDKTGFIFLHPSMNFIFSENKALFWIKLQSQIGHYRRDLKQAAQAQGVDLGTHDIRRFFINTALKTVKDIHLVSNMVGHSRIDNTIRYLKDRHPEATEATDKMQEGFL